MQTQAICSELKEYICPNASETLVNLMLWTYQSWRSAVTQTNRRTLALGFRTQYIPNKTSNLEIIHLTQYTHISIHTFGEAIAYCNGVQWLPVATPTSTLLTLVLLKAFTH